MMLGRPFRAAFSQVDQKTASWGAAVLVRLLDLGFKHAQGRVQGTRAPVRGALPSVLLTLGALGSLAGCGNQNPVMTPVGWWHDLQGGEIAATRPPPPGADLPYPKLGTIPPKPVLPSNSFRNTVRDQLAEQRDNAERQAARTPIETVPPPPPPPPKPAAPQPGDETANATIPAAEAAPAKPAPATNAAAPPATVTAGGGPAPGTPVTLAGAPADTSGLPPIPEGPPAPATFEGVQAVPAPTPPPPLPVRLPAAWAGSAVLFATGSAVLDSSQIETLKDVTGRRGKGHIDVEGHGDAQADSPEAQQAALDLAVRRAQAVAADLVREQHVPPAAIRLSATAFGRGASLRTTP
jgi:outer membrane protein OmpA-like peptidoglycan-associated protein